jgi:hypothetical protein
LWHNNLSIMTNKRPSLFSPNKILNVIFVIFELL